MSKLKIQSNALVNIQSEAPQDTEMQNVKKESENSVFTTVKEEQNIFNYKVEKKKRETEMLSKLNKINAAISIATGIGALSVATMLVKAGRKPMFQNDPIIDYFAAIIGGTVGFVGTMFAGSLIASPFKYNIIKNEYSDITKDDKEYEGSKLWGKVFFMTDSKPDSISPKQPSHNILNGDTKN